jgi:hypothetical protein
VSQRDASRAAPLKVINDAQAKRRIAHVSDAEVPHVLSGDTPNSFFTLYGKVNEIVLEGRGELTDRKQGLSFGDFSMIDNMNDAAHVGFPALQMIVNIAQNPEYTPNVQGYLQHLETYCIRLTYMLQMSKGGKDKQAVLAAVINLHRPASYWEQKSKEAREAAGEDRRTERGEPGR